MFNKCLIIIIINEKYNPNYQNMNVYIVEVSFKHVMYRQIHYTRSTICSIVLGIILNVFASMFFQTQFCADSQRRNDGVHIANRLQFEG